MEAFYRGRVVLVVGGSSGMGYEMARGLLKMGARVAITARNPVRLKQAVIRLQEEVGAKSLLFWHSVDAADYRAMRKIVTETVRRWGQIDVLLQCAGKARPGTVESLPLRVYRDQIRANYLTTVSSVRAVLPEMRARQGGQIACIGSTAGEIGVFGYTAYGSAKFAVHGFCESLRMELRPQGIIVSLVLPPDTDTPGYQGEQAHNPPELMALNGNAGLLSAQAVAGSILRGVARGRFRIVPGFQNRTVLWLSRHMAGLARAVMDRIVAGAGRKKVQRSGGPCRDR